MIYSKTYFVKEPTLLKNLISIKIANEIILEVTAVKKVLLKIFIRNENDEDDVY